MASVRLATLSAAALYWSIIWIPSAKASTVGPSAEVIELSRFESSRPVSLDVWREFHRLKSDSDNRAVSNDRALIAGSRTGEMAGRRSSDSKESLSARSLIDVSFCQVIRNLGLPSDLLLKFLDLLLILHVFGVRTFFQRHIWLFDIVSSKPVRHLRFVRQLLQKFFLDHSGWIPLSKRELRSTGNRLTGLLDTNILEICAGRFLAQRSRSAPR